MDGNGKRDFPNSGILFRNDEKRDAKDRDYQGSCDITCSCGRRTQFWLSAWLREGRQGKFLSLKLKAKDAKPNQPRPAERRFHDDGSEAF